MPNQSDDVLRWFRQEKTVTLNELTSQLACSNITARRRLKTWDTYTSYNHNGRYYTLKAIPTFDKHGIWQHKKVFFF